MFLTKVFSVFRPLTESSPDFPMDSNNFHCRGPNGGNLSVHLSLSMMKSVQQCELLRQSLCVFVCQLFCCVFLCRSLQV